MSRIRTIKPEWLTDERIAAASDAARLMSVALILLADDHGRGRANPNRLAADVWGYCEDEGLSRKSAASLRELETLGFVRVYQVRGQSYYEIANWRKHQRIDNAGKPRVPPPEPDSESAEPPVEGPPTGPVNPGPSEPRGESPRTSASLGVSPPDPDPDPDLDHERDPRAREPRGEPRTPPQRPDLPPLDRARLALERGYAERYQRATALPGFENGDAWQGASANGQAIGSAAAWCAAEPDAIDERVRLVLEGVFADPWMASRRWPWGPIAKDPAKFAAAARGSAPPMDELTRLRAALDALEPARNRAVTAGARGVVELARIEAEQDAIRVQIAALRKRTNNPNPIARAS